MRAKPKTLTILLTVAALGTFAMTTLWPGCAAIAPLAAEAGPDTPVNVGQSIVLQGSASGGSGNYTYSWSPTAGLTNSTIAQPTFTPTTIGTVVFTLTVTDSTNGDIATDTVTVTVGTTSPPVAESWKTPSNTSLSTAGGRSTGRAASRRGLTVRGCRIDTPRFLDTSTKRLLVYRCPPAEVAELVDALDSGSSELTLFGVRVPASAPLMNQDLRRHERKRIGGRFAFGCILVPSGEIT